MTQTTDHGPPFDTAPVPVQGGRRAALVACLVRGATAAGLGLGAFAVLVMVMWVSAPHPDNGPNGALHVAASLWLLAHGAGLVRAETLSGQAAPIGLVPLLLVAVPVWLIHRAARDGLAPDSDGRRPRPSPQGAVCAVTAGYLLVAAVVTLYATGGSPAADPMSALVRVPALTLLAATAGVWTAKGRPGGPLPGWLPEGLRVQLARSRVAVALKASAAGGLVLLGGGALLVAAGLVWHADAAQDSFLHLADAWSGRLAVLLLGIALAPNAAVWGAAYGLGPGFELGTASTASPLAVTGDPALPQFPLVAAIPAEGPGTPLNWACAVLPVAAALVIALFTIESAAPKYGDYESAWSIRETALTALLGAIGCGVLVGLAAAVAGGAMGTERLAVFGPVWWLTGAAALGWSVLIAVPVATVVRVWRALTARFGGGRAPRRRWPRRWGRAAREAVPAPQESGAEEAYDFLPQHPREGEAADGGRVGTGSGPVPKPASKAVPKSAPGAGQEPAADAKAESETESETEEGEGAEEAGGSVAGSEGGRLSGAEVESMTEGEFGPEGQRLPEPEPEPEPEPDPDTHLGAPDPAPPSPLPDRPWAAPLSPWPAAPGPHGLSSAAAPGRSGRDGSPGEGPGEGPDTGGDLEEGPGEAPREAPGEALRQIPAAGPGNDDAGPVLKDGPGADDESDGGTATP